MRDLRSLIERVRDWAANSKAIKRLLAVIEWCRQSNRYEIEPKVRQLACEILNYWNAITALVDDPQSLPTNNDAERAGRRDRPPHQLREPNGETPPPLRRRPQR